MRLLKWIGGGVIVLLLSAGVVLFWYSRAVLPQVSGTLRLAGLKAPVDVVRDAEAVPHIYAQSDRDAYFAQGFVQAQDRLWQMEINRRIANGRLAEALGEGALPIDRFLRTIGIRRAADAIWARLPEQSRSAYEAYAAGVNAYLAARKGPLPPEFLITGAPAPEPWVPQDSVGWIIMMAWDLGDNWKDELFRLQLAQRGWSADKIAQFLPPDAGGRDLRPDLAALYKDMLAPPPTRVAAAPMSLLSETGVGSNNWVLAGSRTASGKPLLANDPHLLLSAPSLWYLVNLKSPDMNVIGASLPGVPGLTLGRNDRIAWGFTNTGPDVQDLYIERIDPANPANFLTPDGSQPFGTVKEVIKVKGAADVTLTVRISRHGPIVSDGALPPADGLLKPGYALAFAWTALSADNTTPMTGDLFAHARDWESFKTAARSFSAPEQNMVYADVDGNIGYVAPGMIPIRRPDNPLSGLAPGLGWSAVYDWTGFIPFEDLPQSFNPPSGYQATANQRVVGPDYKPFLTNSFDLPLRADRIKALIEATPKHDVASMRAMQADIRSGSMASLLPRLTRVAGATPEEQTILGGLRGFDAVMRPDGWQPLVAAAWLRELTRLVYADDLGDLFDGHWDHRTAFMMHVLSDDPAMAAWCDDLRTPQVESCDDLISRALTLALADLRSRYGADYGKWRWDVAHQVRSAHRPFDKVPLLAPLFDLFEPVGGDRHTLDVAWYDIADEAAPYAVTHGPSLRAIYDFSDLEQSRFIQSTGQSGLVVSPYYRNLADRWAKVQDIPMRTSRASVEVGAIGTLTLAP